MFNYTVKIYPIKNPQGKLRAFASMLVDDVLEIKGFRIVEGRNGLFVSAPSTPKEQEDGTTKWYNDIMFREEVEEGSYEGPIEAQVKRSMLDAFKDEMPTGKTGGRGRSGARVLGDEPPF